MQLRLPRQAFKPVSTNKGCCSNATRGLEKSSTHVGFRVNSHPRHGVIVFHVLLPYLAAVANSFDALTKIVFFDGSTGDGALRHKSDGCARVEGLRALVSKKQSVELETGSAGKDLQRTSDAS